MPTVLEKLDVIREANALPSQQALAEFIGVRSRQTLKDWRDGKNSSTTNEERLDRAYREALKKQREARMSPDDYRRRAIAALNLLEGDELVRFARELVSAAAAQEFTEPGEAAESAVDSDAQSLLRKQGKTQPTGA